MKYVINRTYGGFDLSARAVDMLLIRKGKPEGSAQDMVHDLERNDPDLVAVVEELGAMASGSGARLKVVEVPEGVAVDIHEYGGVEWLAEIHRVWC